MDSRKFLDQPGFLYQWLLAAPDGWLCAFFVLSWTHFSGSPSAQGLLWTALVLLTGSLLLSGSHLLSLRGARSRDAAAERELLEKLRVLELPESLQQQALSEQRRMDIDWQDLLASRGLRLEREPAGNLPAKALVYGGSFLFAGTLLTGLNTLFTFGFGDLCAAGAAGLIAFGWARHRMLDWGMAGSIAVLLVYGALLAGAAALLGPRF